MERSNAWRTNSLTFAYSIIAVRLALVYPEYNKSESIDPQGTLSAALCDSIEFPPARNS